MHPFRFALMLAAATVFVGTVTPSSAEDVVLAFSLEIDRDVYDETVYGSPPQFRHLARIARREKNPNRLGHSPHRPKGTGKGPSNA